MAAANDDRLFADTSFFVSFLSLRDEHHSIARKYMADHNGQILTTEWVLLELGNYLAATGGRRLFSPLLKNLREDSRFVIVWNRQGFEAGVHLYDRRPDKRWSLTDCISFTVMQRQTLTAALTADHHFRQAGFELLLK
jgi:predicted nucleic acid-binding protein